MLYLFRTRAFDPRLLIFAAALLPGCRCDSDQTSADNSSGSSGSGDATDSTSGEPESADTTGTTDAPATTDSTTSGSSDDDDGNTTTGGPEGEPVVRLLMLRDYDTPGTMALYQRDFVDGSLTEPTRISGDHGSIESYEISPSQRNVLYELDGDDAQWFQVQRDAEGNAGPPIALTVADHGAYLDADAWWSDDETHVWLYARWNDGYRLARFEAGSDTAPQLVMDDTLLPGTSGQIRPRFSGSGERFAMGLSEDTGRSNLWTGPLTPPDPTAPSPATDLGDLWNGPSPIAFTADDTALLYWAEPEFQFTAEIFAVELGAVPNDPVRLLPPLTEDEDTFRFTASPDNTKLAFYSGGSIGEGEVYLLDLTQPAIPTAVELSTLGDNEASPDLQWTPDSRHLIYWANHDETARDQPYVVDTEGGAAGTPALLLGEPYHPMSIEPYILFGPDGTLYVAAGFEAQLDQDLYRIPLTDEGPGPREALTVSPDNNTGSLIVADFAADGSSLLLRRTTVEYDSALFLLPLGTDEIAEPSRLDDPTLGSPSFFARYSPGGEAVIYRAFDGPGRPAPGKLVFLDEPGVAHHVVDDMLGVSLLDL